MNELGWQRELTRSKREGNGELGEGWLEAERAKLRRMGEDC